MREQIQAYVNGLFADAALTIRNAEVRQEILQHTLDRYDDLVASGKPEQEAFSLSISLTLIILMYLSIIRPNVKR